MQHSPTERAAAAIDRYLLPAAPTAANPPHKVVAGEWDRQPDGHRIATVAQTLLRILCGQCQQAVFCIARLPAILKELLSLSVRLES